MTPRAQRRLAWLVLAVFTAAGLAWLARLDFQQKISTDVLDLLPVEERDPQLAVVREMAGEAEGRTMLLVLTDGAQAASLELTRDFAAQLARSPHFSEVIALADPQWREAFGRTLFESRFTLLFPLWLREQRAAFGAAGAPGRFEEWVAGRAAAELETFLESPQGIAFADLVPADPLLLVPRTFERLTRTLFAVAGASDASAGPGLIWAQIAASPLTDAGQGPVFAAIDEAASALRGRVPGLHVAYTGVNRFAQASRVRIQREVTWLNTASLVAVLAVSAAFIRRLRQAVHLLPVVLLSLLAGWVVTTAAFERVHIVVFVLGSLLAGIAIDYGFHIFAHPPARPGETYGEKLRRLAKPLCASCLTTVVGFALLLGAELPLLKQLGVFVMAGLLGAALTAVVYFAAVGNPHLLTRGVSTAWLPAGRPRRWAARAVVALGAAAMLGLVRLRWRDEIRELEVPAANLKQEDARIRALFGQARGRAVWLTSGESLDAARDALRDLEGNPALSSVALANLGPVVPTAADVDAAWRFAREHPSFGAALQAALARKGFDAAGFEPWLVAWSRFAEPGAAPDYRAALAGLQRQLAGPLRLLVHTSDRLTWFVSIASSPAAVAPPPGTRTIAVSQLETLNELFARYRRSALRLSLAGLAVIATGVVVAYGIRNGLRIFCVPVGACIAVFGLFGWLGQPLTMFHLLGAFLSVCLTYDYAIFCVSSPGAPPASVRLAALTTAASFGVLATSAIPAVRALGLTVALAVVAALATLEVSPVRTLRGRS